MCSLCVCNIVDDDNDHQLSITSLPGGGVALLQYDLPHPLKGINLIVSLMVKCIIG